MQMGSEISHWSKMSNKTLNLMVNLKS